MDKVRQDLKDVMECVMERVVVKYAEEPMYVFRETYSTIEYVMKSKSKVFANSDPEYDFFSELIFNLKLPEEMKGKADGVEGEVGEDGNFFIYAYKYK